MRPSELVRATELVGLTVELALDDAILALAFGEF
jgi:hypothetical protein